METPDYKDRRITFRRLHENGCFVIPNPWDVGTARVLAKLGFPALASTSAGFAFSEGLPDGGVTVDAVIEHLARMAAAVDVPLNADFESGYAGDLDELDRNVRRCVAAGVAGLSIEDSTGNPSRPLRDLDEAVERIRTARAAIDATGTGVLLTARSECYLTGHPDPLDEALRRLAAYAEAGADVLYAPGPRMLEDIRSIVAMAGPKPVNVLVYANTGLRVADLAEAGVRRVSVGSALSRAAWTGFLRASRLIAEEGSFAGFDGLLPFAEVNGLFRN